MSDAPPVSLIIVNLGRRSELALALKGLEYQRYRNFELIVVSDLAPEQRPQSPLGPRWFRFTERNISAARNIGIAAARGEIIAFCDDDAVPEFGWLAALTVPFADPAVGAAGGFVRGRNGVSFQWTCIFTDTAGRDHPQPMADCDIRVFGPETGRFLKTVGTNCAFRREALLGIGGFDEAYRFFLDEADVNARLAAEGWSAAIVPDAEVHHGFASGPYRTARRVPVSLHEIGASQAYFLARHAAPSGHEARLEEVRAEQRARLGALFDLGLVDARRMRALLDSLEAGFAEGAGRSPLPGPREAGSAGRFQPVPPRPPCARRLFVCPILGGSAVSRAAAEAAAAGDEVTLLRPEISHRPLVVRFREQGYFDHRFGLFGKSLRDAPRPFARLRIRIDAERRRIARQRGPFEP